MDSEKIYEEIIIAGFGGQGIIMSGKLLAQCAMSSGHKVTYMPSYGAEVRGGTANCMVVISNERIASPVVTEPNSLITMNKASLSRFAPKIKPNGLLIYNSSLIDTDIPQLAEGVKVIAIPADETAVELGSKKSANMVMLGAYLAAGGILEVRSAAQSLQQVLAERYHKTIPANTKALEKGAELALTSDEITG
jgi:2-oxoglutarate ferredoxin oxidoreductase subunit gamma